MIWPLIKQLQLITIHSREVKGVSLRGKSVFIRDTGLFFLFVMEMRIGVSVIPLTL